MENNKPDRFGCGGCLYGDDGYLSISDNTNLDFGGSITEMAYYKWGFSEKESHLYNKYRLFKIYCKLKNLFIKQEE